MAAKLIDGHIFNNLFPGPNELLKLQGLVFGNSIFNAGKERKTREVQAKPLRSASTTRRMTTGMMVEE